MNYTDIFAFWNLAQPDSYFFIEIIYDKLYNNIYKIKYIKGGHSLMEKDTIQMLAREIYTAEKTKVPIKAFTESGYDEMSFQDAYNIQLAAVEMKKADGQTVVGKKIGLTNISVQKQRGIDEPDYGHIMDNLIGNQDIPFKCSELMSAPFVECELAFVLEKDITGPGVTSAAVLNAARGVIPAFEVIERRFWPLCKSVKDSICDNAACGKIILGSKLTPIDQIDFRTIGVLLEKNGRPIDSACSSAVYGSPVESVAWLVNKLSEYGVSLKAGEIIMSGSITMMHEAQAGDCFYGHFGNGLGNIKVCFEE